LEEISIGEIGGIHSAPAELPLHVSPQGTLARSHPSRHHIGYGGAIGRTSWRRARPQFRERDRSHRSTAPGGTPVKRLLVLLALLPALLALNSCGGSSTAAVPSITVSGAASSVNVTGPVQFTASILNLSST